jgi:hypothetical protein
MFGLAAVTAGAIAMLSNKGRGRHSNWGTTYFWFLLGVFVTMSALSFMRWAENYHLFILGVLSFASALFGRIAVQRRWRQWPRLHLTGMGVSYILLLTAFYVDNGKSLPPMEGASSNRVLVLAKRSWRAVDPIRPATASAGSWTWSCTAPRPRRTWALDQHRLI